MKLEWGAATHTGLVRETNQDSHVADGKVFAVADGMGGHAGGEVASRIAIDALRSALAVEGDSSELFAESFEKANLAILAQADEDSRLSGMGTTMTAALFLEDGTSDRFLVRNIGDSRAYILHEGDLHQITNDHTYVQQLIEEGSISVEEGKHHRQRHILTRVLGVETSANSDVFTVTPQPGDVLLLCSDGLFNHVVDHEIAAILASSESPQRIAEMLVEKANLGGGTDNTTTIVVRVLPEKAASHKKVLPVAGDETAMLGEAVGPRVTVNPVSRGPVLSSIPTPLGKKQVSSGSRLVTVRSVLFFILVLLLVGGTAWVVNAYANHAYYVGTANKRVAIYHGRPGGVLWYQPSLVETTSLPLSQLNGTQYFDVSHDVLEPSLQAARAYVTNLRAQIAFEKSQVPKTTTSPTSTTTTLTAPTTSTTTTAAG